MKGPRRDGTLSVVVNVDELGLEDLATELRARLKRLEKMGAAPGLAEAARCLGLVELYISQNAKRRHVLEHEERDDEQLDIEDWLGGES